MSAKTITFINEKGGIGKTTICFNVAYELSKSKKVLLIDIDGQRANLTYFCGIPKPDDLETMFDVLQKGKNPSDTIKKVKDNLYIIPASSDVAGIGQSVKVSRMRQVLNELGNEFDFIFIDVSPSPNWGHFLALASCQYAIIPMLPEVPSLEADNGIVETINEIKEYNNSNLKVLGIFFNRNENRSNVSKQVKLLTYKIAERLNTKVFESTIRNAVSINEAVYNHIGITEHDPSSAVAEDVRKFVEEFKNEVIKNG